MSAALRILLVDDQPLVRAGLRTILESEDGLSVVGEAGDGAQAVALARELDPDVICMDVQMPGVDGLEATRRISAEAGIRSAVLMLTTFNREDYLFGAIEAGASGFLLKNSSADDLIRAIRVVASGEALLDTEVTRAVLQRVLSRPETTPVERPEELGQLTPRESEVLERLARGASNQEIAESLYLGEATVKTHVSNVLLKLRLRDRIQAVVFAYEHGIVRPGDPEG